MLSLLGSVYSQTVAAGGVAFADGFEGGANAAWGKDGNRNRCSVTAHAFDGGAPHGGSSMLICNWDDTLNWGDPNAYTTL